MSAITTNPKLSCPLCRQRLRFKRQLREGTKYKCPNCNGHFVFATNGPNAETETYEYESEIPDFEILASDFDKPKSMDSEALPPTKVTKTGGPFLSSARRLFPFVVVGFSTLALGMFLPSLTFSKTNSSVKDQPVSLNAQAEVFLVSELDKWIAHQSSWANAWHTEGRKDCHPRGLWSRRNAP
jgi:hypothetical protein